MKVNRQRNPYLKRILSQQPHKYSYDIEQGKYYLLDEQGKTTDINSNGTFRPKFRPNYSGFVSHKSRYNDAKFDPSILHFAPNPNPNTPYYNPVPDKFTGYAQYPYQMKEQLPTYLAKTSASPSYPKKKTQSLILGKEDRKLQGMGILEYSTTRLSEEDGRNFFNEAWSALSETKPLPKQKKKTCYNYKCKYLKQWVFDERGKLQARRTSIKALDRTQGQSFHQEALLREMQEEKLVSTIALSGVLG